MNPNWKKKLFPTTLNFCLQGATEQQLSELIHIKSTHSIRPPDWLWNIQLHKLLYGVWQRLSTYKTKFPAISWGLILGKSRHINKSTAVITSYKCGLANVFDLMNDISIQNLNSKRYADYSRSKFNLRIVNHWRQNVSFNMFNIKQQPYKRLMRNQAMGMKTYWDKEND